MNMFLEVAGVAITIAATLFLVHRAMTVGPMRSLARVWLAVEAAMVLIAMLASNYWISLCAAVIVAAGVPIAGLMLLALNERSRTHDGHSIRGKEETK